MDEPNDERETLAVSRRENEGAVAADAAMTPCTCAAPEMVSLLQAATATVLVVRNIDHARSAHHHNKPWQRERMQTLQTHSVSRVSAT